MEKLCANCKKLCKKIRKGMCGTCYNKSRIFGDPNYSLAGLPKYLTEQQTNIIIGSALGDGHIRKKKEHHNASLTIRRAQKDLGYLEWEASILGDLLAPAGITKLDIYDDRTGETYHACEFSTRSLVVMNPFHATWYKDKAKIIPTDLKLNAEIIAVWFCDDGTIQVSGPNQNRFGMSFATNSFSKDEVYFLRELLNDRYNEHFTVSRRHDADTEQYVIHAADAATRTLIADIDPVFPQGMQRKRLWDDPTTCFYENQPVSHRSTEVSYAERMAKIIEYLGSHNEFYLSELGRFAGFAFDRKSRKADGEVATSNITRCYLNQFLKDNLIIKVGRGTGTEYTKGVKYQLTPTGKTHFQSLLQQS